MKYKLIIFIILLFIASNLVCAGWWNTTWNNKHDITINNTDSVSHVFEIIKLDISNTSCVNDPDSVRVVKDDTTLIPFQWYNTSKKALWFINNNTVTAGSVDTSYALYCNASGVSAGNTSLFLLADDFDTDTTSLWEDNGYSGGSISWSWNTSNPLGGVGSLWVYQASGLNFVYRNFTSVESSNPVYVVFRKKVFDINTNDVGLFVVDSGSCHQATASFSNAHYYQIYNNYWQEYDDVNGYANTNVPVNTTATYLFRISIYDLDSANSKADWSINNVVRLTGEDARGTVDDVGCIGIMNDQYNNKFMLDDIFVSTHNINLYYTPSSVNLSTGNPDYFTITAHDYYNTSFSILNFSAVVNGTSYNTTTGTITTNIPSNASVFVTINLSSDYNGGYFNRSYYHNVSTDLSASLWQSVITLRGVEKATGKDVNNFSVNTTYKSNSTSTGELVFRFQAGDYVINVTPGNYSPAYYGFQKNISVNPLDNKTVNLSFYNTNFTLFVKEIITNLTVTNYNLTAYYNVTGWSETHTNQSSNTTLHLTNETYRFIIYAPGFAPYNDTLRVSNGTTNQTIFLYSANSLWVYAREEELGGVISNFSVLIYNAYATYQNDSDINQSIAFFNNVTPGLYTVRVTSPGYSTRYYNVTMTSGHHADLTAYLSVVAGNTTLLFKDKHTHETLEDVNYAMYRIINGSWQVISSGQSDITGRVFLSYTPYTEYKFICSKTGYEQKNFTLQPVYGSYDVLMTPIYEGEADLQYGGVTAYLQGTPLNNNNNLITLFVSSPHGTLLRYGLNLSYKTIRNGGTGNNAVGGSVPVNITVMGASINDYVNATYWWNESNGNYGVFSRVFYVGNASGGNVTLEKMRTENFGMSTFELVMISMGVTLAMAGMGALLGGAMGAGILSILCMSVFTYLGFVPLYAFIPFALISLFVLISSFRGGY